MNSTGLTQEHCVGASSELKAAAHYTGQGHQVYFPMVSQSHVDFILERQGKLDRVQVKTATWNKSYANHYLQARTRLTNKHQDKKPSDCYDLFVVVHENDIWEIPADLIKSSNISLRRTNTKHNRPSPWEGFRRVLN